MLVRDNWTRTTAARSEASRRRIEALLKGVSSGSALLAAADQRINRALADAVERHATKDPGMRGMLKRASVVCHPESEAQKKNALDTEQDSPPPPAQGAQLSKLHKTSLTMASLPLVTAL